MNKEKLLQALNSQLKGKEFSNVWSASYDIAKVAENILKEEGYRDFISFNITCDNYKANTFFLRYKGYTFAIIRIKRVRGDVHWSWYNDHARYDWTYGEFTCDEDFDFFKKACEIEDELLKAQQAKNKLTIDMTNNLKKVKELFGENTYSVVNYLSRHYFELNKKIEETNNHESNII